MTAFRAPVRTRHPVPPHRTRPGGTALGPWITAR